MEHVGGAQVSDGGLIRASSLAANTSVGQSVIDSLSESPGAGFDLEPQVRLPSAVVEPDPKPMPVLIMLAPVCASLVIFAFTQSPIALAFAALGPVFGLASWLEGIRSARRSLKHQRREYQRALQRAEIDLLEAQELERAERRRVHPTIEDLRHAEDIRRVPGTGTVPMLFTIGTADLPGQIRCDGGDPDDERAQSIRSRARRIPGSPVTVAAETIAIRGPASLRVPVMRALWLLALANGCAASEAESRIIGLDPWDEFPRDSAQIVLRDGPASLAVLRHRGRELMFSPERASIGDALRIQALLGVEMTRGAANEPVSDLVSLASRKPGTLAAAWSVDENGPRVIDLVEDGPHAVIGGTTGSGKSEVLLAWAASLAAAYGPDELALLCLDFKGGATFDPIADLPHCAGLITDLDGEAEAERCLTSLRAELRRREQVLRENRCRTIADTDSGLPRLVVMVDEFQALLMSNPELHTAFVDIASRGRSLGIHLVLCTQRPAGAVKDALMANCTIRVCLRVTSAAESQAVIGVPDAANIPPDARGRAIVHSGTTPKSIQGVRATADDIAKIAEQWASSPRTRSIIEAPLPLQLLESEDPRLKQPGVFGLSDAPELGSRLPAAIPRGGGVLVLGKRGSGKSTALRAMTRALAPHDPSSVIHFGDRPGTAWMRMIEAEERASSSERIVLVVDDADALASATDEVRRVELAERLATLIRTGENVTTLVSMQRAAPPWNAVVGACGETLVLAAASKQDHVIAGEDSATWSAEVPPGRGRFNGRATQVLDCPIGQEPAATNVSLSELTGPLAVISRNRRTSTLVEKLGWRCVPMPAQADAFAGSSVEIGREPAGEAMPTTRPVAMCADPDAWMLRPEILTAAANAGVSLLIDGVSPGEYRTLMRQDPTLPPVDAPGRQAVLRTPEGWFLLVTLEAVP